IAIRLEINCTVLSTQLPFIRLRISLCINKTIRQNSESTRQRIPPGFMNKVAVLKGVEDRRQVASGQGVALAGLETGGGQKPPAPPRILSWGGVRDFGGQRSATWCVAVSACRYNGATVIGTRAPR